MMKYIIISIMCMMAIYAQDYQQYKFSCMRSRETNSCCGDHKNIQNSMYTTCARCSNQCSGSEYGEGTCNYALSDCDLSNTWNCRTENGGQSTLNGLSSHNYQGPIVLSYQSTTTLVEINSGGDWLDYFTNTEPEKCPQKNNCWVSVYDSTNAANNENKVWYYNVYFNDNGILRARVNKVYHAKYFRPYCTFYWDTTYTAPVQIQVDCNVDPSCTVNDLPEFSYPSTRVYNQYTLDYAINGSSLYFNIDKPIVTTCQGRCEAYYYLEVYDDTGTSVHPTLYARVNASSSADHDYVTYLNEQRLTEDFYSFKVKIVSYNNHTEWYQQGNQQIFSIWNYCGPYSATISIGTDQSQSQFVDKNLATTYYITSNVATSVASCYIKYFRVYDSQSSSSVSTIMGAPVWDSTISRFTVAPFDTTVAADYVFYTYFELHGDPNGQSTWTGAQYLYVGCTESITMTQSDQFVQNLDVNCLTPEVGAYTWYHATVYGRSAYCAQQSHSIIQISDNGVSSIDAVSFSTACNPSLADPSCSSITIKNTYTPHVVTFQIQTMIEGRSTPYVTPVITLDIDCRSPDHSEITSSIVTETLDLQLNVERFYEFLDSNFTCNCNSTFCSDYTYSVVTDSTGNTQHSQISSPVQNPESLKWVIHLLLSDLNLCPAFHIKATSSQGKSVVSGPITLNCFCGPLSSEVSITYDQVMKQYVDLNDQGSPLTFYTLPALVTNNTGCFVETVIACDQGNSKSIVSTQMGQPTWDATSGTWRAAPLDKGLHAEYIFYAYVELDGIPNGPSIWTSEMQLVVGCTESTTMTDSSSPAFVTNHPVNCLDHTETYTFFVPYKSRTYCEFTSHTIMDVKVNGVSTPGAVWFTETCAPNVTHPSCSSVSINTELVDYTNTITFHIWSTIFKRTSPHISALITLDLNCRDSAHTFLTSHIIPPSQNLTFVQFYGHIYAFNSSDFSCNCPATIFCQTITYTTVDDTSGLLPNPIFNETSNQWEIAIHFQELVQVNFSIQATTSYGVSVVSDLIQILIIDNCMFDNVTLNATKGVDEFLEYTTLDGFPIMRYQADIQVEKGPVKINMTQRFLHTKSDFYCGFSDMMVFQVVDYTIRQPVTRHAKFFNIEKLGGNDTFELQIKYFGQPINYAVYVYIWNGEKWSAGKSNNLTAWGYLLDARLYDSNPYMPEMPPLFKSPLMSPWTINITKNPGELLQYQIPEPISFMDENLVVEMTVKKVPAMFAVYDEKSRNITVDTSLISTRDVGEDYTIKIKLDDTQGLTKNYELKIEIIQTAANSSQFEGVQVLNETKEEAESTDKDGVFMEAKITKISVVGKVEIEFTDILSKFDLSMLNDTYLDLYIQPALDRQFDTIYNNSQVNFTWNCTKIINNKMLFKLKFNNPYEISPLTDQDWLIIYIKDEGYPLFKSVNNRPLLPENVLIKKKVPKQMPDNVFSEGFLDTVDGVNFNFKIMLIFVFLMNQLLEGSMKYMSMMIRFLQVVLHLPMMYIAMPSNVLSLNKVILEFAMFDILSTEWTTDLLVRYQIDKLEAFQNKQLDQQQDLGYETHYTLKNLGSLGLFMVLYFIKLTIYLIMKGITRHKCFEKWEKTKQYLESQKNSLFYSDILALIIDGYFEFGISLFLQLTYDWSDTFNYKPDVEVVRLLEEDEEGFLSNLNSIPSSVYLGDVLSRFCALLLFVCLFIVFPMCLYRILTQDIETVMSMEYQEKFAPFYEYISLKKHSNLQFFAVFCFRRFFFILIVCVLIVDNISIQLCCLFILNIFMTVHTGHTQPFDSRLQNRIIMMNELGIGLISYHMLFFTDWVHDQEVQSNYGWSMICFTSLFTGFNLSFILFYGGKSLYLLGLKYSRRSKVKINNLEARFDAYEARIEQERIEEFKFSQEIPPEEQEDGQIEMLDEYVEAERERKVYEMAHKKKPKKKKKTALVDLIKKGKKVLGPMEFSIVNEDAKEQTEEEIIMSQRVKPFRNPSILEEEPSNDLQILTNFENRDAYLEKNYLKKKIKDAEKMKSEMNKKLIQDVKIQQELLMKELEQSEIQPVEVRNEMQLGEQARNEIQAEDLAAIEIQPEEAKDPVQQQINQKDIENYSGVKPMVQLKALKDIKSIFKEKLGLMFGQSKDKTEENDKIQANPLTGNQIVNIDPKIQVNQNINLVEQIVQALALALAEKQSQAQQPYPQSQIQDITEAVVAKVQQVPSEDPKALLSATVQAVLETLSHPDENTQKKALENDPNKADLPKEDPKIAQEDEDPWAQLNALLEDKSKLFDQPVVDSAPVKIITAASPEEVQDRWEKFFQKLKMEFEEEKKQFGEMKIENDFQMDPKISPAKEEDDDIMAQVKAIINDPKEDGPIPESEAIELPDSKEILDLDPTEEAKFKQLFEKDPSPKSDVEVETWDQVKEMFEKHMKMQLQ